MSDLTKNKINSSNTNYRIVTLLSKIFNPKRDWKILLSLFAIFIILVLIFDYYMYKTIAGGEMFVNVNRKDIIIQNLKKNELQNIFDEFQTKKANFIDLKITNLIDPSL